MGYSNNKWRKVLTILMIINLCFILFARFSSVFGASVFAFETPRGTITFNNFPDNYYYFLYYAHKNNSNSNDVTCLFSETPMTVSYSSNNDGTYTFTSSTGVKSFSGGTSGNFSYTQRYWLNYNFENSLPPVSSDIGAIYFYNNTNYVDKTYFTNHDVKDTTGNIVFDNTTFISPHFDNITEIEQGYPDGVFVSRGSYSENETLYFHLLKITNTINDGNNTIYYYSPKIFALTKDSKYYRTYDADTENKYSYYYINRSALSLDTNSSYLYVLSNSSESFTNSYGILQPDIPGGIYDVIQSDTTGVITSQDSTNDKIQNIDDTLNDNTVSSDTETNIEDSLKFDNKNDGLNNLNNGFFSRLTSMLSNLLGYNLSDDTSVSIPFPNSDKHLILHSKDIYNNVTGAIRVIINAFWTFIFTFYLWKFINKIYISVSSGNILDSFSSSGEAITNDML